MSFLNEKKNPKTTKKPKAKTQKPNIPTIRICAFHLPPPNIFKASINVVQHFGFNTSAFSEDVSM